MGVRKTFLGRLAVVDRLLPSFPGTGGTLGALALGVLLAGCGTVPHPHEEPIEGDIARLDRVPKLRQAVPHRKNIWKRYRGDGLGNDPLDAIPIELNPQVEYWISYFSQKQPAQYRHYLMTGEHYRAVVEKTLVENGVPSDVYFLGMIESGYRMRAHSSEGAVGFWQFRKHTARSFGLQLDDYVDERRDPIRSTRAAARYLRRLRTRFGDWYLAIAAYNVGDGRLMGAEHRAGTNDFWEICEKEQLPTETCDYVPKFLAAATIGKSLSEFGFTPPSARHSYPEVEPFKVPSPIKLREVAKIAGIPLSELKKVNRHLKLNTTPPNGGSYLVWVPKQAIEKLRASRAKLVAAHRIERQNYMFQ